MKESYRELKDQVKPGNDIIIIARNTINQADFRQVKRSLRSALNRGKLLKETKQ